MTGTPLVRRLLDGRQNRLRIHGQDDEDVGAFRDQALDVGELLGGRALRVGRDVSRAGRVNRLPDRGLVGLPAILLEIRPGHADRHILGPSARSGSGSKRTAPLRPVPTFLGIVISRPFGPLRTREQHPIHVRTDRSARSYSPRGSRRNHLTRIVRYATVATGSGRPLPDVFATFPCDAALEAATSRRTFPATN